ncbi:iron complex transport system permease protein [Methanomicrobium sp. W14]|uniref:FecCD family ABC transporter permease n=1 Tax=Methanomicrobium sp. W14 TaxID=2817839 RepID=UPI001AE696FA|nr:iron ABC transporter permease [Methanomicrobium sp. W14]MBP2133080.1 iron complex transport system permease protein [Methanomicrobium sp. W14]
MARMNPLTRFFDKHCYGAAGELSGYHKLIKLIFIAALLLLSALAAVMIGAYTLSVSDILEIIWMNITPGDVPSPGNIYDMIVWNIRLPRIALAICVGGALAMAGAVFQSVFKNPLVEPYILGVSSGAAFGAALAIVFPVIFPSIQLSAFFFGALAVMAAYLLAYAHGETPLITLILAGVIIGSVFSAFVSLLKYVSDDSALREIVFWLMGGFYYATWDDIRIIAPSVILGFILLCALGWKLNILSMGDDEARALGVNPEVYKFIVISIATFITAFAVSLVGIIAWVGLMMPHAARMILGPDNRYVIPASFMMGGIYMIFCDTIARTITNAEIPVGIIASILGAPYLCYLLRNRGKFFG